MKHNSYFKIIVLFIALLTAGNGCKKIFSDTPAETAQNPINIEVESVKLADSRQQISYSGTIEESENIPLSFPVTGTVEKVLVSEGDTVRKGQLLAVLNNESYRNAHDMALATEKQAEDANRRLQALYNNGNLPEIKLVEIETNLKKARSGAAIAKKNLDDCSLYAAGNGFVGKRSIEPGMIATPNLNSIQLIKIEKVYARISVSENEIAFIKKDQKANIKIGALQNRMFAGKVEEIGVMANPLSHTYKIKIGINNKDMSIRPGMICEATIDNRRTVRGYMIPNRALLVDESGNNYVYTVNHNRAKRITVKPGNLLNSGIEILEGLNKNDIIVVSGQHKLSENAEVKIITR